MKKIQLVLLVIGMISVFITLIGLLFLEVVGKLTLYIVEVLWRMIVLIIEEMIRLWPVLLLTMITWYLFMSGIYDTMSNPIQMVVLKTLLTVSGILVAHIVRKALLPKIDWSNDHNWQLFVASYSMYLIIPYCFAMGG